MMMMKIATAVCVVLCLMATSSQASNPCPQIATPDINVAQYVGVWYEIATTEEMRLTWEKDCLCTYANYSIDSTGLLVQNGCRKNNVTTPYKYAYGQAIIPNPAETGKLEVSFYPEAPYAPYWIIVIEPNYSAAVIWSCQNIVGFESYSMWVLSRTPTLDSQTYNTLISKATALTGINASQVLIPTVQTGCPALA